MQCGLSAKPQVARIRGHGALAFSANSARSGHGPNSTRLASGARGTQSPGDGRVPHEDDLSQSATEEMRWSVGVGHLLVPITDRSSSWTSEAPHRHLRPLVLLQSCHCRVGGRPISRPGRDVPGHPLEEASEPGRHWPCRGEPPGRRKPSRRALLGGQYVPADHDDRDADDDDGHRAHRAVDDREAHSRYGRDHASHRDNHVEDVQAIFALSDVPPPVLKLARGGQRLRCSCLLPGFRATMSKSIRRKFIVSDLAKNGPSTSISRRSNSPFWWRPNLSKESESSR